MPDLRAFLARFRPSGTPGAPADAGVPADRAREQTAELEPVLATLADGEREAERIRAAADAAAVVRLREARTRADALVADARRQAEAELAALRAEAKARAATRRGGAEAAATAAAERVRAYGRARLDNLAAEAAAPLLAALLNDVDDGVRPLSDSVPTAAR